MSVGKQVKIPDIGPLATVVRPGKRMVKLELELEGKLKKWGVKDGR